MSHELIHKKTIQHKPWVNYWSWVCITCYWSRAGNKR